MADELIPVQLTPPPGVVKTESPRAIEGRWSNTEKVRFVHGKPQKIGGWTKQTATAMSGPPRTLHAWRDNSSIEYIAGGTYKKLYVTTRSFVLNDITPILSSGNLTNPFSTTNTSTTVTVAHTAHGRRVGDTVIYSGASAVGGITISGSYLVNTATTNSYTIVHSAAATSTAGPGGGTVAYQYEIAIGTQYGAYGLGWGTSGWGLGTWGTPRTASSQFIEPRVWSIDHFGQILLATYNVGSLYKWDPSAVSALTTRATIVSDAPTNIRAFYITPERFCIALCESMTIKWSVQGDYTTWTPTSTNTAGSRGVTEGTKLIGGKPLGGGVSLIFSDAALYVHQYTGSSLVFDTRLAGRNCGLISPSAVVTVGSVAYWMGQQSFFLFNGAAARIPNVDDIRSAIFDNLKTDQGYLCAAMYVQKFNEVWFFVVQTGSSEPGTYAAVNLNDYSWATGTLTRVGGAYFQHGDTRPYWASDTGHIYLHEDGHDDDGSAMDAYVTLAPAGLQKGKALLDIEGVEADFHEQSGDVSLTLNTYDRIRTTSDTPLDTETQTVTTTDGLVDFRLQGRYAGMTVRSNTLGGYFRLGVPTVYIKEDGSRR